MGIDAQVAFRPSREYTNAELGRAQLFIAERIPPDRYGYPRIERRGHCIEVVTLHRYYGPGYERGPWPEIDNLIRTVRAAFPGETVLYSGDTVDPEDGQPFGDDDADAMWRHWFGPHWNDYRKRRF